MLRGLIICIIVMVSAPAFAQGAPAPQNVTMPADLVNRIYLYLGAGGTFAEATGLREAVAHAVQAPQREADIQKRIDAAVAAAKVPVAPPKNPDDK